MRSSTRQIGGVLTKTGDASNTLFSERYQQTYHSTFGAAAESSHVFLKGAGVEERLRNGQDTRILEIGFGLGLNCLLCADCATTHRTKLEYTGIDHQLIAAQTFNELGYRDLLKSPQLADDLATVLTDLPVASNPPRLLGSHALLTLYIENVTSPALLNQLSDNPKYDAIFLDAFSPDVNPECWTSEFLQQLAPLLKPAGRLATYCVKGAVQRSLRSAGFLVHKYPGPTGKREVLWASL